VQIKLEKSKLYSTVLDEFIFSCREGEGEGEGEEIKIGTSFSSLAKFSFFLLNITLFI
jgi:hypothetical protein